MFSSYPTLNVPLAFVAFLASHSVPAVYATEICTIRNDGKSICRTQTPAWVHFAIAGGLLVGFFLILGIYSCIKAREDSKAIDAAPSMAYAAGTVPANYASHYDPNGPQYPTQAYPFAGYGAQPGSAYIPPPYPAGPPPPPNAQGIKEVV